MGLIEYYKQLIILVNFGDISEKHIHLVYSEMDEHLQPQTVVPFNYKYLMICTSAHIKHSLLSNTFGNSISISGSSGEILLGICLKNFPIIALV